MTQIADFFIAILTAVVLQNVIFTRGLGSAKAEMSLPNTRTILMHGACLTAITASSSIVAWLVNHLLRTSRTLGPMVQLRYVATLICIALAYVGAYYICKQWIWKAYYYLHKEMGKIAFNSAVLGSLLIAFASGYGFFKTVGFAIGSGVGYTAALLLVNEGRRRIALCDVPRPFRGFPITLLYVGIVSLAIYGLIGHQLPT